MERLAHLSSAHCLILAVHFASSSQLPSLRSLTRLRSDAFNPELVFRVLLTYLPESVEPSVYIDYIVEIAAGPAPASEEDADVDASAVSELSDAQVQKRSSKLRLLPIAHPTCPQSLVSEPLPLFLIHRAYRIDAEVGLLSLVPQLLVPFLDRSQYLKTWFISTILPLLRLNYELRPNHNVLPSLAELDSSTGLRAVDMMLAPLVERQDIPLADFENNVASGLRGVVGPWMYGDTQRKRRRLNSGHRRDSSSVSVDGAPELEESQQDWQHVFEWMVREAERHFDVVSKAVENWSGPSDVDLGGYADEREYLTPAQQRKLELFYIQTTFSAIYAADSEDFPRLMIKKAHGVLSRAAEFTDDYDSPPDLNSDVQHLPSVVSGSLPLRDLPTAVLQPDAFLKPDHALTTPKPETYSLLVALVFSSYILVDLGFESSIINNTRIWLRNDSNEQFAILQAVLHALIGGPQKQAAQWAVIRGRLLWLWNWGMATERGGGPAAGILGKIAPEILEQEILKSLLSCSCYDLAIDTYVKSRSEHCLSEAEIEHAILSSVFVHYENASNGNRTRGGMKKASDIVAAFSPYFPQSTSFPQLSALLAATHSLSFYSLTLQHGVPFQPVSIRVSNDPLGLIEKVLSQNPRSYTKLDDLIGIARNFVAADLDSNKPGDRRHSQCDLAAATSAPSAADLKRQQLAAERRVIGMAIQAALAEDDFETAYSYVVNRLNIQSPDLNAETQPLSVTSTTSTTPAEAPDDPSWRAALAAGRYRPPSTSATPSAHLRNLQQRMDLLTHALLLAPPASLPEILAAYRRCEEELLTTLAAEDEAETQFNDAADRGGTLPGAWGEDSGIRLPQQRREMGRAVGRTGAAGEDAPVGLFDVARGAADAFRRSAFAGGKGGGVPRQSRSGGGLEKADERSGPSAVGSESSGDGEEARVRRRDMVANAVTGGLASGIGWVLGASPVHPQDEE